LTIAGLNDSTTGGTVTNTVANTLTLGGSGTYGFSGVIQNGTGTQTLTKSGAGTQTLSGANTYTGNTNVNSGTLLVNGNQSGATGAVTVASGATLGGSGTVGGATVIQTGGFLSPGNSIGTTTFGSGLTINGTYLAQLGTPGATPASGVSDRAAVTGALTLTGGTLSLSDNAGANSNGSAGAGAYRLITFTGARTDQFTTVTNPLSATLHEKVVYNGTSNGTVDLELYRLAAASAHSPEPVNLGVVHIGGAATQALTISNSAANDGFSEKLNATIGGVTGDATASGSVSLLTAGSSSTNLIAGINTASGGNKSGTATITLNSDGTGTSGYGTTGIGTQTVNVSGQVFNGIGVWTQTSGSSASWGSGANANWTDANGIQAAPGTFAGFDNVDTATFNGTGTTATVNLDGVTPSIKNLNFSGATAYNIATGSGTGSLALKSDTGDMANVTVSGNTAQTISAAVTLASSATVDVVSSAGSLTAAGGINGIKGLVKTGAGTLNSTGADTYQGTTTVSGGTLLVNGTHTSAGAYDIQSGGTLGGSGTITMAGNAGITLQAGAKLSPGGSSTLTGTLTAALGSGVFDISAGVNASSSQSLLFDLATTAASDRVLLSNAGSTFNIGTGKLEFNDFVFATSGGFGAGTYTLFDTNNINGVNGSLGSLVSGAIGLYTGTISIVNALDGSQDIILTVTAVPEPATYGALAGLALSGLSLTSVIRRRRKRTMASEADRCE
jgi:fibronectin-binding autotransporter adhesin